MTWSVRVSTLASVLVSLHFAATPASAVSHLKKTAASFEGVEPSQRAARSAFTFTVEALSPSTQMDTDLEDFLGPYFFFLATNTGQADTYDMLLGGLDDPDNWWPQVCVGFVCFPGDSIAHSIPAGEADTLGLNVVANTDGVDSMTFTVRSQGNPSISSTFAVTLYAGSATVDIREIEPSTGLELRQNMPNPVRAATSIRFVLPHPDAVDLRVYDVTGRAVRMLSAGQWPAGSHAVEWDGRNDAGVAVPAGVYYYRLVTPEGSAARRMTVVR
jgi:hypothetical protein